MAEQFVLESELAASIWKLEAVEGADITPDDEIMILESMKMEIPVTSKFAGQIVALHVIEGQLVTEGQPLATIEVQPGSLQAST